MRKSLLIPLAAAATLAACAAPATQEACARRTHFNSGFYNYTFDLDGCHTRARLEAEGRAL